MKYTIEKVNTLNMLYSKTKPDYKLHTKIRDEEYEYIIKFNKYIPNTVDLKDLKLKLSSINLSLLNDLSTLYQDHEMMLTLTCIFLALTYEDDISMINKNRRIRLWLNKLKNNNVSSTYNHVFLSSLKEIEDLIILKTEKLTSSSFKTNINENISHDIFIGLFGTNNLRKINNNIVYVIGGFTLSPVYMSDNNEILTWGLAQSTVSTHYAIYEKILPSTDLKRFLYESTTIEFLQIYLQLLYTLGLANSQIDFCHNDLHDENVLIKKMNKNEVDIFYPKFGTLDKDIYVRSKYLAVIIDLGMAHIKYNNKHFGPCGFERYGITHNRSFILGDAFRVLLCCYHQVVKINNYLVEDVIKKIFKFFSNEDIDEFSSNLSTFHILPYNPDFTYRIEDLIEYVISSFPSYMKYVIKDATNNTSLSVCKTVPNILDTLGVNEPPRTKYCFELYDILSSDITDDFRKLTIANSKPSVLKIVFADLQLIRLNSTDLLSRLISLNFTLKSLPKIDDLIVQTDNTLMTTYFHTIEILIRLWDEFMMLNVRYESLDYVVYHFMINITDKDIRLIRKNVLLIIKFLKKITTKISKIKLKYESDDLIYKKWKELFNIYDLFFTGIDHRAIYRHLA